MTIAAWLPTYQRQWLRSDAIAGLTLAAYAIPVSVAYASLAGLPPQAGLYCYFAGGIAYSLFGTSRQAAIGPTSAMSILIGSTLATIGSNSSRVEAAAAVAVIAGFVGILARALHLGNLTNFVSETVLSGFKVGAGLVIASTQLPKLLGISTGGSNFFTRIGQLLRHLPQTNLPTFLIGLGALMVLVLGARFLPGRPIAVVVVIISTAMMSVFPMAALGVKTVGTIPQGLPQLHWPVVHWSDMDNLLGLALACFLLSYVESISVVRTFAGKHRYPVDADQELLALGVANLAAGIAQGFPVAGGMSQSAVNEQAGAKTPMALVVASAGLALVLLFLTRFMSNLPQPVLAAIVLTAVGGLIRLRELRHLARVSKSEFVVAMVATAGVLGFGILKGVLLAALFSIVWLLQRASHPRIAELGRKRGTDHFADLSRDSRYELVPQVLVLRIEGGMFYFNCRNAQMIVLERLSRRGSVNLVVLDLSTSANIDVAGVRMLLNLNEQVKEAGAALVLAEVHGQVRDLLQREELAGSIPGVAHRTAIAALIREHQHPLQVAS